VCAWNFLSCDVAPSKQKAMAYEGHETPESSQLVRMVVFSLLTSGALVHGPHAEPEGVRLALSPDERAEMSS
jgi:hypothetical protein